MSQPTIDLDESKLEDLQTKVLRDIAGSLGLIMAYMGDRLDLYSALAELGEATSQKLAESTGLDERYVREWLSANAAVGYVNYDSGSSAFSMSPEQFVIFGQEGHPACMQGFFQAVVSTYLDEPKATEVYCDPWSE